MNVIFAGTPEFAAGYLEALIASEHQVVAVITQPDKPGRRGKSLIASPVKAVALKAGLPVLQPTKLTSADLEPYPADLMIVVAYGQILRQSVLDIPASGCVNVHASLLPRWRGAAPVQRAILAGDTETGVTLIQMDAGLDTGEMLATAPIMINDTDTASDLFARMSELGHPLLLETLDAIAAGNQSRTPQNDNDSTYAKKLDKSEAMIDWQADAQSIHRQVRAFNPDPIAFTYLGDKRVKVHEIAPIPTHTMLASNEAAPGDAAPGEIISLDKKGLTVRCGDGEVLIKRLQLPLGKGSVLGGNDMVNGYTEHLKPGEMFHAASSKPNTATPES